MVLLFLLDLRRLLKLKLAWRYWNSQDTQTDQRSLRLRISIIFCDVRLFRIFLRLFDCRTIILHIIIYYSRWRFPPDFRSQWISTAMYRLKYLSRLKGSGVSATISHIREFHVNYLPNLFKLYFPEIFLLGVGHNFILYQVLVSPHTFVFSTLSFAGVWSYGLKCYLTIDKVDNTFLISKNLVSKSARQVTMSSEYHYNMTYYFRCLRSVAVLLQGCSELCEHSRNVRPLSIVVLRKSIEVVSSS